MIISRTPYRISFFGGGTDYPAYFEEHDAAVMSTTIDKYCYISCRYLPPFFEHKSRIVWSQIELINKADEIKHPSVRECLKFMQINDAGVEIHHNGDLPARTGIGSSSSFTIGLLNSLYALKGEMVTKMQLAKDAIYVEQDLIRENVGCQDQIVTAFGGLNIIEFKPQNNFNVYPVTIDNARLKLFQEHLLLVFTGFSRTASEVVKELINKISQKKNELKTMYEMVYEARNILNSKCDIKDFGKLLHQNWLLKKNLANNISTSFIDEIYESAMNEGAIGGKLLGAGGGGFILIFAEPGIQHKIKKKLKELLFVSFEFENSGSQIVFYSPEIYQSGNNK